MVNRVTKRKIRCGESSIGHGQSREEWSCSPTFDGWLQKMGLKCTERVVCVMAALAIDGKEWVAELGASRDVVRGHCSVAVSAVSAGGGMFFVLKIA